ncbi:MAG: hypothetical protein IKC90_03195 [Akkermansia sp.]|nr:hypothetical protein [Akkermansia sp.]
MSKQRLVNFLEKGREVLDLCINDLMNGPIDKDGLKEGIGLLGQIMQYAEAEMEREPQPETTAENEELYTRCVELVRAEQKAGTALLQRRFNIGYGRAAKMIDMMIERNVISPKSAKKSRHKVY